ncbi:MAG TPA: hypothetical protein VNG53_08825 [Bacteroidia bacterium]|nr:hypothetical protein [Bacteroidia bacterium]
MIYAYKHLTHRIEKFNANIFHFFEQLFANDLAAYDENVLLEVAFIPIVNRSSVSLKNNLAAITTAYHDLSTAEKLQVQQAFTANADIKNLCGDITALPVKYDALPDGIKNLLKTFLTKLWEDFPLNDLLEADCGTVQDHFSCFVAATHQRALICPFCGLNKLKTSESVNRDAYDHYIPKAYYPFISINFKNLFPICHECNSDEKKTTDTLYKGADRRQVFYPLDTTYQCDQLSITITPTEQYNPVNFKTLLYDINWSYTISLAGNADPRLTSWDEIFHIKRRYTENVLRYQTEWYDELVMRYKRELNKGTSFVAFMNEIIEDAEYQKLISPFGMLRHSYFEFLFSIPDFEVKLNEALA